MTIWTGVGRNTKIVRRSDGKSEKKKNKKVGAGQLTMVTAQGRRGKEGREEG